MQQCVASTLHTFVIDDIVIKVRDCDGSQAAQFVAKELVQDSYGLSQIQFAPGDVVVDVGGHIGLFAIYLGLRFPALVIHSFEPFPDNCHLFRSNLALNSAFNVHLYQMALSSDGRCLEMATNPVNSGGATCNSATLCHRRTRSIPSMTLDQAFDSLAIQKCKLLKIDCEGSEYEILLSTSVLPRVEHLRGEFHTNSLLSARGYSVRDLLLHCEQHIDTRKIIVKRCRMSE